MKKIELAQLVEKSFDEGIIYFQRTIKEQKGIPFIRENINDRVDNPKYIKILDKNFNVKKPIFTHVTKEMSLVPIEDGDFILKIFKDQVGLGFTFLNVKEVNKYKNTATVTVIFRKNSDSEIINISSDIKIDDNIDKYITFINTNLDAIK